MTNVLKIGGGAGVDHRAVIRNLAERIQAGERWVLVHGTSAAANELATRLGVPVRTITSPGGHVSRHTDAQMIGIYGMAAASVNQQLCAELSGYGVRVAGLTGPTVISAQRKQAIRAIQNGRPVVIRDDFSGRITGIDRDLLESLLDAGYTPVIAPLAIGESGESLNVDGDLVAATAAHTLNANLLMILSNVPGLLRDVNDATSLVENFTLYEIERYENFAAGRMKKKLLAAREAKVEQVILADSRLENPINAALTGAGTHIWQEGQHVGHHA
ncbi:MAG: [LysW]-aminoadipate kinase [Chloroflexi bacterium]|nr:[LysW]-aminoadipate kinase [Chloroflexota bacterium]